jgi:hypothetical protein
MNGPSQGIICCIAALWTWNILIVSMNALFLPLPEKAGPLAQLVRASDS